MSIAFVLFVIFCGANALFLFCAAAVSKKADHRAKELFEGVSSDSPCDMDNLSHCFE